jgi:hypothetical protein
LVYNADLNGARNIAKRFWAQSVRNGAPGSEPTTLPERNLSVDDEERSQVTQPTKTWQNQFNLYGGASKGGKPLIVLGEAKARIHAGDASQFLRNLEKAEKTLAGKRLLPVMFGFWIHPSAQTIAKTKRIRLVASYQR